MSDEDDDLIIIIRRAATRMRCALAACWRWMTGR